MALCPEYACRQTSTDGTAVNFLQKRWMRCLLRFAMRAQTAAGTYWQKRWPIILGSVPPRGHLPRHATTSTARADRSRHQTNHRWHRRRCGIHQQLEAASCRYLRAIHAAQGMGDREPKCANSTVASAESFVSVTTTPPAHARDARFCQPAIVLHPHATPVAAC